MPSATRLAEHFHDLIVEDPRAVGCFTATTTHLGLFQGLPATGRQASVDEIAWFRIDAGRVAEQWFLSDDPALDHQLRSP